MNNRILTISLFLSASFAAASGVSASIAERATRAHAAGVEVITYRMETPDVVTLSGSLPAGDLYAGRGNIATASVTGMMLSRGTTKRDKLTLGKALDATGAQLSFEVSNQVLSINARFLRKDAALVIGILAEELRLPAFSSDELEKAKTQFIAGVREQQQSTEARAAEVFSQTVYPAGHANRVPDAQAMLTAATKLTTEDLKAFHGKYYGPAHLTLVFAGDVDARAIQSEVGKSFAGWKGGVDASRRAQAPAAPPPGDVVIRIPDKASVSTLLGQATGLRYADADALALRVGTAILGSGFTGRLMTNVRDKQGLTYGIGAGVQDDAYVDGAWLVYAAFAPTLLDKGVAATREEVEKWWQNGITDAELAARKTSLIGSYQVGLATTGGVARTVRETLERGKPLSWLDAYPKAIEALTVDQVNAAIRKYLDPRKMVLVEVGTVEGT